MEINDTEIVWLYVVDSGKWLIKRKELISIAEDLMEKGKSVEGIVRYLTVEEIEEQAGAEKKMKAIIKARNDEILENLKLLYKSDMDNVNPEYIENLQFFRAKMVDFEMVLPGDRVEPVEVRLNYHSSGIFILELWLKLKNMALTPDIINELQLLPREEEEITVKLPRQLLEDYSLINRKIAELLQKKPKSKIFTLNLTFHEIVWMYWAIIAYIANNEKAKDSKELLHSLRYNVFHFFPIMVFHFPEVPSPEDLFEKHKADLYRMLFQEIYLDSPHIRPQLIDDAFKNENNLAERTDDALFFSKESCILLYTKESQSILSYIAEKRKTSVEAQIFLEKLDVILVQEFLNLQRYTMEMYDYLLSKKSISEMETDELAQMRGSLSKVIEEFYNVKLLIKTSTHKRLERGRIQVFELEKSLEVLEKKLDLVDAAVTSIHNNLMEFLTILLGILVQVGPIIAVTIVAPQYAVIAATVSIGVFIGVYFLYKQLYRIWYRRSRK
ncbi:MAG: hypothetical protein HWN65_09185 [Candidatus Helarchaeota archaeon]|nr:hypothetical protein [Candidatus Helarchaeota archaeon]